MKANFHTHTELCRHAQGKPEDYAEEAVKKGLSLLAFTDHAPFPDADYGYRMMYNELDLYIEEVLKTREDYSSKLKVLNSVEIEYLPKYENLNYYNWLLSKKNMDFLLLGQHFFETKNGNIQNITSLPQAELAVEYAESCRRAMKTGYFKIMAHPDLFCINEQFSWNDFYEKASDIIIESALLTGTRLEYNANGLRRGIKHYPDGDRYQYPHENFWKKVQEAGISVIAGSDAHSPEVLWDSAMEGAVQNLKAMNLKTELINA